MKNANKVEVFFGKNHVGTIAQMDNTRTAFQYTPSWTENGFSISPISLPLTTNLFVAEREPFEGLFGVFNDSLPDGWGRLIADRYLRKHGMNPQELTPLTRLTLLVPDSAGGLRLEPTEPRDLELRLWILTNFTTKQKRF